MNRKFVKRGIILATLAAVLFVPIQKLSAADAGIFNVKKAEQEVEIDKNCLVNAVAEVQKQQNSEKTIKIETAEEIQFNQLVSGKTFVTTVEGVACVTSMEDTEAPVIGKVFETSTVKILTRGTEWCEIQSGNVIGYVETEKLITGKDAVAKIKEILAAAYPGRNVLLLTADEINAVLTVGETIDEEQARLAAEEAARIAEEQARIAAAKEASRKKGEGLVAYAKQFLGNPYVWGGTSLTRGTDCSGFVMGVYKKYGVSLPHSSYGMRRVGRSVSYSEMQPGDIVCYSGHVGIYAGNGKIVNALNEDKGIVMTDVKYSRIITIRRIF